MSDVFDLVDLDELSDTSAVSNGSLYSDLCYKQQLFCTLETQALIRSMSVYPEVEHLGPPANIWSMEYTNHGSLSGSLASSFSGSGRHRVNSTSTGTGDSTGASTAHTSPELAQKLMDTKLIPEPMINFKPPESKVIPPAVPQSKPESEPTLSFRDYLHQQVSVPPKSRFFVIKSYSIVDVKASFINSIWSSTELGNKRLAKAYKETLQDKGNLFLYFLVNGSGRFCGMAQMTGQVDFKSTSDIWAEDLKWKGIFPIRWISLGDIPNKYFHHLTIPANDNKRVTNSRDTQEIPFHTAIIMFKIFSSFKSESSFLD